MYIEDTSIPKVSPIEYKDWGQFQEASKKYGIQALHRTREPHPTGYVIWFPFQGFVHRFKIPGGFKTYEEWQKGKAVGIEHSEHYRLFLKVDFRIRMCFIRLDNSVVTQKPSLRNIYNVMGLDRLQRLG